MVVNRRMESALLSVSLQSYINSLLSELRNRRKQNWWGHYVRQFWQQLLQSLFWSRQLHEYQARNNSSEIGRNRTCPIFTRTLSWSPYNTMYKTQLSYSLSSNRTPTSVDWWNFRWEEQKSTPGPTLSDLPHLWFPSTRNRYEMFEINLLNNNLEAASVERR